MPPVRTLVQGEIRGVDGVPIQGAIIEAQLISQMEGQSGLVGNESHKTFSNEWGRFWFELVPTIYDAGKPNNYYAFKIISNTTNYYYKTIPDNGETIRFEDLPDFTAPDRRPNFIGGVGDTINIGGDYTGVYTYLAVKGDGVKTVFDTPGRIHMVALNGVVQRPSADYVTRSSNSIEFNEPPMPEDVVLLQYKI